MQILIWIISGIIAGWLAGLFGLQAVSWLGNIITAAIGGVILVVIVRILRRA